MKYTNEDTDLQQKLIELRQLEEAARVRFNKAKDYLINIKREIADIERLLKPPVN